MGGGGREKLAMEVGSNWVVVIMVLIGREWLWSEINVGVGGGDEIGGVREWE